MRRQRSVFQRAIWTGLALHSLVACSSDAATNAGAGGNAGSGGSPAGAAGSLVSSAAGMTASSGAGGGATAGGAAGAFATAGSTNSGGLGGAGIGGHAGAGGGATAGASGTAGSGGAAGTGGNASAGSAGSGGSAGGAPAYLPCPTAAGATCSILPLGDSITEGFGSSGAGYRVELFRQAVQNGKGLSFVGSLQNGPSTVQNKSFPKNHEGHDGFTIDSGTGHSGISGSITDQAIANYHPNIVLLMIGTNDINGNIDVANAPSRLGNLIDDITTRAPNALVVVATIIAIANPGTNAKVETYDAALPGLVNARAAAGKHVILVDNYAAFTEDPNYQTSLMSNYLHPNDAGYVVLGRSFYSAISALLPGA